MSNKIQNLENEYHNYLNSLKLDNSSFKFTKKSKEQSYFALCFAIFGYNLIDNEYYKKNNKDLSNKIRKNFCLYYNQYKPTFNFNIKNKKILQLLCFSLSALSIVDDLDSNPFNHEIIQKTLDLDLNSFFADNFVFQGKASSGNISMFVAIILIYANKYLNLNCESSLDQWIECHLKNLNSYGVWSTDNNFSYKHFQNSYHQYEIFNYLNISTNYENTIAELVSSLADRNFQFAPYLGGGSCYDYDAIFFLTNKFLYNASDFNFILNNNLEYLIKGQNFDGGFGERLNEGRNKSHAASLNNIFKLNRGFKERFLFYLIFLKHKNIYMYSAFDSVGKTWFESNLWDSWFRVLTIKRILKIKKSFINFPGIGFY